MTGMSRKNVDEECPGEEEYEESGMRWWDEVWVLQPGVPHSFMCSFRKKGKDPGLLCSKAALYTRCYS